MIVGILVVWLVAFFIWNSNQKKKKAQTKMFEPNNYYIAYHQQKLKNDRYYEEYLKWCYDKNEIPMSKHRFIREVENNEDKIKNLLK